jgi:hypothetical protein
MSNKITKETDYSGHKETHNLRQTYGISLLESSLCFTLFCALLMMGSGLWDYVDVNNGLTHVATHYAYESSVGAYQYNKALGRYEIDLSKLRKDFAEIHSKKAFLDLKKELRTESDDSIRLEFALTTVAINTISGRAETHKTINSSEIISVGSSPIPGFLKDRDPLNGEIDFNFVIEKYIEKVGDSLAIPTQSFGVDGSHARYFPTVPLIAVRAVYNYQNTGLLKAFGILEEPYGWDVKVSVLRGEVG